MALVSLARVFDEFCAYFDGKMRWSAAKDSEWTDKVLSFFSDLRSREEKSFPGYRLVEVREYMNIDYVWRSVVTSGSHIELAVEHENTGNVKPFLEQEIQHLIDLKADNKIAITYPHVGDEEKLVRSVCDSVRSDFRHQKENYLLLLGFATRTGEQAAQAILVKGHFIDSLGRETSSRQKVILQAVP